MKKDDWILLSAFGVTAGAIVLAAYAHDLHQYMEFVFGQTTAAWVQAIGSILTLFIAFRIAFTQINAAQAIEARKEFLTAEDRAARASLVGYRVAIWLADLDTAIKKVTKISEQISAVPFNRGGPGVSIESLRAIKLDVPVNDQLYTELHYLPPETAALIAHILYAAERFDRTTAAALAQINSASLERAWTKLPEAALKQCSRMEGDRSRAEILIAPIVVDRAV